MLNRRMVELDSQQAPGRSQSSPSIQSAPLEMTPEEYLRSISFDESPGSRELGEDGGLTLARRLGRAVIQMEILLDEDSEQVRALRRLPSIDSIANSKGATLTAAERQSIEATVLPKYSHMLEPLVPRATAEINDLILLQYDQGGYELLSPQGPVARSNMPDAPDGEFRMGSSFGCLGTPYTVSFEFNSGAYPSLDSLLKQIALIKSDMKQEVYLMLQ